MRPTNDFNNTANQDVTMDVQTETQQSGKGKNTATIGIAAALGAAFGVSGAAAASTLLHDDTPIKKEDPEINQEPEKAPQPEVHHHYHPQKTVVVPVEEPQPEPEVKVTSYELVTDEDGNRMEVANITIDGHIGQVLDGDSDGYADVLWIDYNNDGAMQRVELSDLQEANTLVRMSDLRDQAEVVIDKVGDDDVIPIDDTDNWLVSDNGTDGLVEPDNDDTIVENNTDEYLPDYTDDNLLADNTSGYEDLGPDYTNDGDVSGFLA